MIDETEHRQEELARLESESNFNKVASSIVETLSVLDGDGFFLFANAHAAVNMSGGNPDTVVGKNIRDFLPWDQAIGLIKTYRKVISTQETAKSNIRITLPSGDKWFLNTLRPIQFGPDNLPAVLSISMDITDTKKAENELIKSEERYRLLSSLTMEGILIHKNGIAMDLNQSLANILGYEYEELLKKDFTEIIHPEDHSAIHENIVKEYALPYEVRAFRKNGEIIILEIESKNFKHQNEKFRVSAIRDVTARKQSLELQRTMAEMLNMAPSSITVHDTSGRFLYANQKTFEIHGHTEPEFMSLSLRALDVPESLARIEERMRIIEESGSAVFEVAHYHQDGHEIPLEVFVRKVTWSGKPAMLSVATDITDRKKAEKEIKIAKEKAEESDRLKSAFLAHMSHEIRTPMNGILGFAELLKEPDLTGEEHEKYIRIIEKSGVRMLNIINEIVNISKIEAGLMKIDIKEININELMVYSYDFFNPEAESRGLLLSFKAGLPDEEAIIKTDKDKLQAILTNLIKNAAKFTLTGSIDFGYSVQPLNGPAGSTEPHELLFFVKDTGIGIPENRQVAIFDRFIQVDLFNRNALQGTGLGLSISKAYVDMLGGRIWVESTEGIGSTFYFTIPYHPRSYEQG